MSSFLHFFFSKNISVYAKLNDHSFSNMLINDIVTFKQLGPGLKYQSQQQQVTVFIRILLICKVKLKSVGDRLVCPFADFFFGELGLPSLAFCRKVLVSVSRVRAIMSSIPFFFLPLCWKWFNMTEILLTGPLNLSSNKQA